MNWENLSRVFLLMTLCFGSGGCITGHARFGEVVRGAGEVREDGRQVVLRESGLRIEMVKGRIGRGVGPAAIAVDLALVVTNDSADARSLPDGWLAPVE